MQVSRARARRVTSRTWGFALAIALALVVTAGACAGTPPGVGGGGGGGGAEGGSDGGGSLAGRTFVSESVTDDGQPRPLVEGTQIRLTVQADGAGISAHAGCNIIGGQLALTPHRLVIDDLTSTEMACPPDRGEQDEWLAGFLDADPAYALQGPRLRLVVGTTVVTLTLTHPHGRGLVRGPE